MKQPEDLTDEPRRGGTLWWVAGLVLVTLLCISFFIPLQKCSYCWRQRQEVKDWLNDPVVKKYREEHPEAVQAAWADLDRIDRNCGDCFRGRITLGSELKGAFWGHHR